MNQRERQQAGLPYKCSMDGLMEEMNDCKRKIKCFNDCMPDDYDSQEKIIRTLFKKVGKAPWIMAPFHCDYGTHITAGDHFICNYNCIILDVGQVVIGDNVQFGPNVCLTTAGHPVHPISRRSGYEYGIPITIGDDVWVGCNVVINPGVTIGNGAVIASGSVVTKDIPEYVVAAGVPAVIKRAITEADKKYYYKDRIFDVDDY